VCVRPRAAARLTFKPTHVVAAVNLRNKLIIIFAALALLPLAIICVLQYRAGAGAVESQLSERAGERASRMARDVGRVLSVQGERLLELGRNDAVRRYAHERVPRPDANAATSQPAAAMLKEPFEAYASRNPEYIHAVTFLDSNKQPVFRLNRSADGKGFTIQTTDLVSIHARHAEGVWDELSPKVLRSPLNEESYAVLGLTVPVFVPGPVEGGTAPVGAIVAEVRLDEIVRDAGEASEIENTPAGPSRRSIVALDNTTDTVLYHTNDALMHQSASGSMQYFAEIAARMRAGESGIGFYNTPEGGTQLVAFRQVEDLKLSLAASEDYAGALWSVWRVALIGTSLALSAGFVALVLLFFIAGRETRSIGLVARSASAVAGGNLDQRIEISHSGETRELAENFNAMTERLRELIAREAESRQFASFMRISAMVSHDLKNAIAGLSMLVSNMEKQFHREEFRADAIESLREATEKLKRTVARLSEPAKSLSGEYRIASRPVDLVPVIRRVLAINAEPTRPLNDIEARLPEKLIATVESERVENVVENLVINGLEAMGAKGGRLTVEAGKLDGDYVFFSVADTGVGMTPEFIKTRLYRPFSTTKNKGIGLGLFTCREVVEAHGGRLEVESSPGAGTRFRVVLPSRLFQSGERRERPLKATAATESALPNSSG
jgi:signal transduction histidine kinase